MGGQNIYQKGLKGVYSIPYCIPPPTELWADGVRNYNIQSVNVD